MAFIYCTDPTSSTPHTPAPQPTPEKLTDADGNVYTTMIIGNQIWTVQNFRTTRYNDGSPINHFSNDTLWASCSTTYQGAYCYPTNTRDSDSIRKLGALYNWYAVHAPRFAPAGWRVPSSADWDTLKEYLIRTGHNWDATLAGNAIAKSIASSTDWVAETEGTGGEVGLHQSKNNKSGFSAYPTGYRTQESQFNMSGLFAGWWSSDEDCASTAWLVLITSDAILLDDSYAEKKSVGFSVRLVRDR